MKLKDILEKLRPKAIPLANYNTVAALEKRVEALERRLG